VHREGNEWIMGTSNAERKVRLADGRFYLSLRNKRSRREYQDAAIKTSEIRFQAKTECGGVHRGTSLLRLRFLLEDLPGLGRYRRTFAGHGPVRCQA